MCYEFWALPTVDRDRSSGSLLYLLHMDVVIDECNRLFVTFLSLIDLCGTRMGRQMILEWCVCVYLDLVRGVNIVQFELQVEAMRAADHIVSVSLCPSCHVSNAVSADVIFAAG